MTAQRILIIFLAVTVVHGTRLQKRDILTHTICDPMYNNPSKVQCYCVKDIRDPITIRSADCFLSVEVVKPSDNSWELFETLKNSLHVTFTNTRGIHLTYIPTTAIMHTTALLKLEIKYGNIGKIPKYAFANSSTIEELLLRDNQIKTLESHSFSNLKELTELNLDSNNIEEVNRNVFVDLPSLEKIFLTNNKITIIHDRAFVRLSELRELELNMNKIFSLNSETFAGLTKLTRLDLSSNKLEVIGDNTFLPLKNLEVLNLEGNMIQMIDNGAFNGLSKLLTLSLAHNKLHILSNAALFHGLPSLRALSLKANQLEEIKPEVMEPILNNFYGSESNLDVDDNNFPCDCRLDWFMQLMNRTTSKNLKIALENLKCVPNAQQREAWTSLEEQDKANGQVFDEPMDNEKNADYEYYDDTQLNGKLFYTDLRLHLITCPKANDEGIVIETGSKISRPSVIRRFNLTVSTSTTEAMSSTPETVTKVGFINHGILDLAQYDTTTKEEDEDIEDMNESVENNNALEKKDLYTTSRLATVSAKPIDNGDTEKPDNTIYEGMASDEAKPEMKAHRSFHLFEDVSKSSTRNLGCVAQIVIILLVRLFH